MTILQLHRKERGWLGPRIGASIRRLISRAFRKSSPGKRLASPDAIRERVEVNKRAKELQEKYRKDRPARFTT